MELRACDSKQAEVNSNSLMHEAIVTPATFQYFCWR